MRFLRILMLFLICATGLAVAFHDPAKKMVPTCYSDGYACPGGCDAHVVFNREDNGTRNAFDPNSERDNPRPCRGGRPCRICFSEDESSCMTVTYRGPGPSEGIFDFTPAFYKENCTKDNLPEPLMQVCRDAAHRVEMLKKRVNCFETPDDPKCLDLMTISAKRKAADQIYFDECRTLGEAKFNSKYADRPALQRTWGCNYEMNGSGGGEVGSDRRLLLPAACGPNSFVGREGLDCCANDVFAAALLQRECAEYFPRK